MSRAQARKLFRIGVGNLLVFSALLGLMELLFRIFEPDDQLASLLSQGGAVPMQAEVEFPEAAYTLVPGAHGATEGRPVVVNSLGMRDREISPYETGLRLAALGDSVTFGWGVEAAESFPKVLEQHLRHAYPNTEIEVVNLGVPVLNTFNEVHRLKQRYGDIDFDLILVGFFFNDAEQTGEAVMGRPQPSAWLRWVGFSAIGRRFVVAAIRHQVNRDGQRQLQRIYAPAYPGWLQTLDALDAFAQIAEHRPVIFVLLPFAEAYRANSDEERVYQLVESELHSRDLPYINVADQLRGVELNDMALSAVDLHPNAQLHALIAAEIFKYLTAHRVIEALVEDHASDG